MSDILDQNIRSSPDTFANAVGDETVLLQVRRGVYFGLDPIGTEIWQGVEQGQSLREVCKRISHEYSAELATVESDARRFIEDLKKNEIVIVE